MAMKNYISSNRKRLTAVVVVLVALGCMGEEGDSPVKNANPAISPTPSSTTPPSPIPRFSKIWQADTVECSSETSRVDQGRLPLQPVTSDDTIPEPRNNRGLEIRFREEYSPPIRVGVQILRLVINSRGEVEGIYTRFPMTPELEADVVSSASRWRFDPPKNQPNATCTEYFVTVHIHG
jgi:hypothetical protein